jgi:hypothetical protein
MWKCSWVFSLPYRKLHCFFPMLTLSPFCSIPSFLMIFKLLIFTFCLHSYIILWLYGCAVFTDLFIIFH